MVGSKTSSLGDISLISQLIIYRSFSQTKSKKKIDFFVLSLILADGGGGQSLRDMFPKKVDLIFLSPP